MATTFLDPGGDAGFNVATTTAGGFYSLVFNSASIATDFVHSPHIKSLKCGASQDIILTPGGVVSDAGARISCYVYLNALPGSRAFLIYIQNSGGGGVFRLEITSAGVLQMIVAGSQVGSDGSTLSTGQWYRLSIAYTITDTTHNEFRFYKDGVLDISVTNTTLTGVIVSNKVQLGNQTAAASYDTRFSDFYIDDSNSLADTGDIWVTAKRPNANGTANNFSTQIGSGGSGYGTGHSSQVNERALSTTNGWSMVGAGSAITEEYSIEGKAVGDINISSAFTIVDFMGWVYASSLASETAQIVVAGASTNISLTSTNTMFTKAAGSSTYPSGGTDIGIVTDTTVTTVSLFECGIMVAFIPLAPILTNIQGTEQRGIKVLPPHFYGP